MENKCLGTIFIKIKKPFNINKAILLKTQFELYGMDITAFASCKSLYIYFCFSRTPF